jgi:hypothetical protein
LVIVSAITVTNIGNEIKVESLAIISGSPRCKFDSLSSR